VLVGCPLLMSAGPTP